MTLMKEKAVEMIRRMPEDNMTYVINILQNLEAMSIDRNEDKKRAQNALAEILSMEKRLPNDFDLKKELEEARTEKIISAINNEQFLDFEDCLQEECAAAETVDYIVTRNLSDFKQSRVQVIEPEEFVKLL